MQSTYAINDEAARSWGAMPLLTEPRVTSMAKRKPFRKIKLTQGKYALVDVEDYEKLIAMGKWCYLDRPSRHGYAGKFDPETQKTKFMQGFIIQKPNDSIFIDHINMKTLDNRKSNLRLCTKSQNCCNSPSRTTKRRSSQYKGVCFLQKKKSWLTQVYIGGKRVFRKTFRSETEAALAYNKYAAKYHGEFAYRNIIKRKST